MPARRSVEVALSLVLVFGTMTARLRAEDEKGGSLPLRAPL
jgi:hypothetical protein